MNFRIAEADVSVLCRLLQPGPERSQFSVAEPRDAHLVSDGDADDARHVQRTHSIIQRTHPIAHDVAPPS